MKKDELVNANDSSTYSQLHEQYHPVIRSYLKKFGYYDIFLCDLESGDIVYSVYKELDFTTSLRDGPYSKTNFGRAFTLAAAAKSPDSIFLVDYEPYTPSYEAAASFISSPIFDGDRKIGVAIFQMPIERINAIMSERTGLGESGETYAVGTEGLFRNDSRFLEDMGLETTIINPAVRVDTQATQSAFAGNSGTAVVDDYRGMPVLSSWTPLSIHEAKFGGEPITWALLSEFDVAEVRQPVVALLRYAYAVLGLSIVGLVVASYLLAGNLTRQADAITTMLSNIGIGDFSARADIVSSDELGQVAESLNSMCDNTLSLIQSAEEREHIESAIDVLREQLEAIAAGNLSIEAVVDEMSPVQLLSQSTAWCSNYATLSFASSRPRSK